METMLNEEVADVVAEETKYGCKTNNMIYVVAGLLLGAACAFAIKPIKKGAKWIGNKFNIKKVDAENNIVDFNESKNSK